MKGVILAGGLGTRLDPLTRVTNKHLLPVYNQPMIYYPISTLLKAGINEIFIVTGGPHSGHFLPYLSDGKEWGIKHLEYTVQKNEGGIADALRLAEDFADNEPICTILGDNCTDADISEEIRDFREGAHIFLKEVPDPQRFGVPSFDSEGRITEIQEKPRVPGSNFAVTGLYIYDSTVFEKIRRLEKSDRGELEVTDLNNLYLKEGRLNWSELRGFWMDAGTPESLQEVGNYWYNKRLGLGRERG